MCSIRAYFRSFERSINEMLYVHLKRLLILFIHGKKKQRHHGDHHPKSCHCHISKPFYEKEGGNTYHCSQRKAYELPFCQIKKYLGFHFGKITRYTDVICHKSSLCCMKNRFCYRTRLKQRKAKKHCEAKYFPHRCHDV